MSDTNNAALIARVRYEYGAFDQTHRELASALEAADARNAELEAEVADLKVWWGRSARATEKRKAERDAALAVIEKVRVEQQSNLKELRFIYSHDVTAMDVVECLSVYASQSVLHTAPAEVLAEHDRLIAEKAWDEGDESGYGARLFEERGRSTDSDAHEYPQKNPYRANPEPTDSRREDGS